ncbi:hypothetical protein [Dyella sp.]|jgi:hypothetical protein|uniref:hypothetical protein n=1 Tax=Dyella sp. TaxID=1869338 RepID=UPI002D776495|nr:hypothetical protein [Dyella sp.]HET6431105.1 hypothetical protein [Dyella sp.]
MQSKYLSILGPIVLVALLYFPARFALTFELFGYPVNSPSAGWLGPTPRKAGQGIEDIGKVNSWRCADTAVFAKHQFGCHLWLRVFGYSGA